MSFLSLTHLLSLSATEPQLSLLTKDRITQNGKWVCVCVWDVAVDVVIRLIDLAVCNIMRWLTVMKEEQTQRYLTCMIYSPHKNVQTELPWHTDYKLSMHATNGPDPISHWETSQNYRYLYYNGLHGKFSRFYSSTALLASIQQYRQNIVLNVSPDWFWMLSNFLVKLNHFCRCFTIKAFHWKRRDYIPWSTLIRWEGDRGSVELALQRRGSKSTRQKRD